MDSLLLFGSVLVCLCLQALVSRAQQETCEMTCPSSSPSDSEWMSALGALGAPGSTSARISWSEDMFQDAPRYIVQYKRSGTEDALISINETEAVELTLTELVPSTQYDVQVCRAVADSSRSDNCGGCLYCLMTSAAGQVPGMPTGITTRSQTPDNLVVDWIDGSATRETGIGNYSVSCRANTGNPRTMVRDNLPISFLMLSPDTSYTCMVVAVNRFGSSPAAILVGRTQARTTVPGALLVTIGNNVNYLHVADGISSPTESVFPLFISDRTLAGIDYHFQRSVLYFTTNSAGTGSLERLDMTAMTAAEGRITLIAQGPPVVMLTAPSGVGYTHVAVDWVNNEIYYVETQSSQSRIMRLILELNLEPYCVVEFSNPITNVAVDPVHGFFYWSTNRELVRIILSAMRTSSVNCPSSLTEPSQTLASLSSLVTFTIEQGDGIYILGDFNCTTSTPPRVDQSVLITDLSGSATITPIVVAAGIRLLESFTDTAISGFSTFAAFFDTTTPGACPASQNPQLSTSLGSPIELLRMYRSAKQPLPEPPGPPTSVRISTTDTTAVITWQPPQFIGTTFSADAFDDWTYIVYYSSDSGGIERNTTSPTIFLTDLIPSTDYFVEIIATGIGGRAQPIPKQLVFRTKADDFSEARLLVADELGVQQSALNGANVVNIGGEVASESNAIAYDSFTNSLYWTIEGGQASLFLNNEDIAIDDATALYERRDNPSALEYDWVSQRLFWGEDGDREFFASPGTGEDPMVLNETLPGVQGTALDALNGLLFWTDGHNISMLTLSGIPLGVCFTPPLEATSLAVDVQRSRLYWLSSSDRLGEPLTVSQMEYDSTRCDPDSIEEEELSQVTFSSETTILAYGSNTLFISNRRSNVVYTVSSELGSVRGNQVLATGSVPFASPSNLEDIRDIVVASSVLQPLPGTIGMNQRSLSNLRPDPPPFAPFLSTASTTTDIIIQWEPSAGVPRIPGSPIFYVIKYSLNTSGNVFQGSETTRDTSVTLRNQQASTVVTANVAAYSLWASSEPSPTGTFTSLPDRPGQVVNVRVFTFSPNTDPSVLTGFVIWDGMDSVDTYIVLVSENGQQLPNIYESWFPDTSYVILQRDLNQNGDVSYLVTGRNYSVQVIGSNQAGNGTASNPVDFTLTAPDYPQQVLTLGMNGEQFLGDSTDLNQDLDIAEPGPIAVDTIGRTAYWYSPSMNRIYSRSLNTGTQMPFLPLPTDRVLLSMAFDWIAECLYMLRRETTTGRLELFRVLIHDTNRLYNVFPDLDDVVPSDDTFQLVMSPFTGFVHWTQTTPSGLVSLHQLNLRLTNATSSTSLSLPSQGRRKKRDLRRSRRQALSSFSLTSALAQDPWTGDLLVCDSSSGNILRCSPDNMMCTVEVDRAALRTSDNMAVTGDAGLPATSLALNEQRLYWARADSAGVYAVDLSATDTLIIVSATESVSSVSALSPGQQVIPANQSCLSPQFINDRPVLREDAPLITNTSIFLAWDISAPLPEFCNNVVFSIPSFTYMLEYQLRTTEPLFQTFTRRTCFTFDNLLPHTRYVMNIAVANEFTPVDSPEQIIFLQVIHVTGPGVPLPPTGLNFSVSGTATALLSWDFPVEETLLGVPSDAVFFVILENGARSARSPNLILDSSLLIRGEVNVAEVIINNGALNSSSESIDIPLWALVRQPMLVDSTNTSFCLNFTLPDKDRYREIQNITSMACTAQGATLLTTPPSEPQRCTCRLDGSMLMVGDYDFVSVNSRPFSSTFDETGLTPFTEYCVQGVGIYPSEVTPGIGVILRTDSGVPGAPNTTLEGSTLSWTEPMTNGEEIEDYTVRFRRAGTSTPVIPVAAGRSMEIDINNNQLEVGVLYDVVVVARNAIGVGAESAPRQFMREGPVLSLPEIAGISVSGAAIISIIAIIINIICFIQCRSSKRGLRSLSYMYGPDRELSNLRDAYRISNPHYTWSREDYVCTDEQLSLLNKFPRNNLKLENFIDRGEFGEVFRGTATDILGVATGPTPVAVKTLRKGATPEEQTKFLSEAALVVNISHPNIVKVLGVCVDNDPVYIIMELMPGGDLLKFLREAKMDHGPTLLTLTEQIQVAVDVAHGCHYLEQQHFIHRDIAARNCLVSSKGSDRVVKIGDFGLAKDLYSSDYYQVQGQRKLPVRWIAPEALLQGKFTMESDIWSYGVLLWEIMTLGNQPYPGQLNQEVLQFVTDGGRMDRPDKCPSKLYHLMQGCWNHYASDRPHFEQILNTLNSYMDRLKRPDSVYYSDSDTDEEGENNVQRQGSGKQRTPTSHV